MLPSPIKKYAKSFSISAEVIEGIDEASKHLGISRSCFIEQALETYLKHFNMQIEKLEKSEAQKETQAA
jgi:metal-responsive CopG/Arc/MetJ family transcriptional regulator